MHRKKPCVGGPPPFKTYFIGRASSGRGRNFRPKTDSQPLSLSLSALLGNRALLWNWGYSKKLAAITPGRVLKIEPTLRQISEETLESLKLRERNFKHRTTPEQPVKPTEGHPQEWRHATTTRGVSNIRETKDRSASFQLKSKVSNNLYSAELVVSISKVKLREFSIWWSTRVKSCGNRTVLDCNHSQLNSLPVRVCMYVFCFMLFSLVHVL